MKHKIRSSSLIVMTLIIFLSLSSVSAQDLIEDITAEHNVTMSDIKEISDRLDKTEADVIESYIVISEVHTMFSRQQYLLLGVGLSLVGGICFFNFLLWKWFIRFIRRQLGIFDISRDEIKMIIKYMKEAKLQVKEDKKKNQKSIWQKIKGFFRIRKKLDPKKKVMKKGDK